MLKVKKEFASYSARERLFVLFAMLCGFFITAEYAVVKPICHSVFIAKYGSRLFPMAWLIAIPVNFFLVSLYNRFVFKLGCFRMLALSTLISVSFFSFSAFFLHKILWLPFILYIFKDIYIMLLFQQLWSVIHATFPEKRAKYLYGIFFGVGGTGAALGSLIPGFFSVSFGSERLLLIAPIFAICLTVCYSLALKTCENFAPKVAEQKDSRGGIGLIRHSKVLQLILILVVCMQISATLLEFQFHQALQVEIPLQDLRTAYLGKLFSIVHVINTCLQFAGSYLLIHYIGLRRAHMMIPMVLGVGSLSYLMMPRFALLSYNYGMIKCFDYSLFAILKEMLYVPLKVEEKFKAKAFIDIFAYRSSKAIASCFLLLIPSGILLSWSLVGILLTWAIVVGVGLTSTKPEPSMA